MTVLDLTAARNAAKAKHPSVVGRPAYLEGEARVALLMTLARVWQPVLMWMGDGLRDHDAAPTMMLTLVEPLVHPLARPALGAFLMPQLRRSVLALDELMDSDKAGCDQQADAIEDAQRDVDAAMFALLMGLDVRHACRHCRHERPVHEWAVQGDCPDHTRAAHP